MDARCHYDVEAGWLSAEHGRECKAGDCRGCRPCGKSHCGLGSCASHVEHGAGIFTCPACIGKARKVVAKIVSRYAELPAEAVRAGIDSEALNLHGPAAAPEQIAARRRWDDTRGYCAYPRTIDADDLQHPLAVLGRWDMAIREIYGPETDLLVTVGRAADFLAGPVLDVFAHTQEFEDFTRETLACLLHLEDVLSDSRKPELGAPCPSCRDADAGRKAPRLAKRFGRAIDGSEDSWHCSADDTHAWSDADYRLRVNGDYLAHATALTAGQMHEQHGISRGSLTGWASLGKVHKRGRSADGLILYDVADALAMRAASERIDA